MIFLYQLYILFQLWKQWIIITNLIAKTVDFYYYHLNITIYFKLFII